MIATKKRKKTQRGIPADGSFRGTELGHEFYAVGCARYTWMIPVRDGRWFGTTKNDEPTDARRALELFLGNGPSTPRAG